MNLGSWVKLNRELGDSFRCLFQYHVRAVCTFSCIVFNQPITCCAIWPHIDTVFHRSLQEHPQWPFVVNTKIAWLAETQPGFLSEKCFSSLSVIWPTFLFTVGTKATVRNRSCCVLLLCILAHCAQTLWKVRNDGSESLSAAGPSSRLCVPNGHETRFMRGRPGSLLNKHWSHTAVLQTLQST